MRPNSEAPPALLPPRGEPDASAPPDLGACSLLLEPEGGGGRGAPARLCTCELIKSKQTLFFRLAPRRRGRPAGQGRAGQTVSWQAAAPPALPAAPGDATSWTCLPPASEAPWQFTLAEEAVGGARLSGPRLAVQAGRPDVAWTLAGDGGPDGGQAGHPQRHLDAIRSCRRPWSHQRRHAKEGQCPDLEPRTSFVRVSGAL